MPHSCLSSSVATRPPRSIDRPTAMNLALVELLSRFAFSVASLLFRPVSGLVSRSNQHETHSWIDRRPTSKLPRESEQSFDRLAEATRNRRILQLSVFIFPLWRWPLKTPFSSLIRVQLIKPRLRYKMQRRRARSKESDGPRFIMGNVFISWHFDWINISLSTRVLIRSVFVAGKEV